MSALTPSILCCPSTMQLIVLVTHQKKSSSSACIYEIKSTQSPGTEYSKANYLKKFKKKKNLSKTKALRIKITKK